MTPTASIEEVDRSTPIVHISDVHGYLSEARSSLQTLGDTDRFEPIVKTDSTGTLHWADNDYVLVVNGDQIDRGPANDECLELVWRLQGEAPQGRVRYHIGNHEMAILLPALVGWPEAYSTTRSTEERRAFLERIVRGEVTAAFDGHAYTYSHAGSNDPIDVAEANAALQAAAQELLDNHPAGEGLQRRLEREYKDLFGIGGDGGRGPTAGLCWLDFSHLDPDSPAQIVGHTKRAEPVRSGNIVCGNIIRLNHSLKGGEGVLVEQPTEVTAVLRDGTGGVRLRSI